MDGDGHSATIIQFPGRERTGPSIEAVMALAPTRTLIDALLAETGLEARDIGLGIGREFAYLARAIEVGGGSDDAIFRLRHLVDTQVLHAFELCEAFQAASEALMALELKASRSAKLGGKVHRALPGARREFRNRAVAARAGTDAAMGAVEALAAHVRQAAGLGAVSRREPEQLQLFAMAV